MSALLLERLAASSKMDLTALLVRQVSPEQRKIVMAALERARSQTVLLEQTRGFAPILAELSQTISSD